MLEAPIRFLPQFKNSKDEVWSLSSLALKGATCTGKLVVFPTLLCSSKGLAAGATGAGGACGIKLGGACPAVSGGAKPVAGA